MLSKEQLLENVVGCHAIVCTFKDVVDVDVLDAAGESIVYMEA